MTHDELLTVINKLTVMDAIFMKDAISGVVELHKPVNLGKRTFCEMCIDDLPTGYLYPCPTVQAIIEGLSND